MDRNRTEFLRQLALEDEPHGAALLLAREARELLGARRASCLVGGQVIEVEEATTHTEGSWRHGSADGLLQHLACAGGTVSLSRAASHPLFRQAADDPTGSGSERLLAVASEGSGRTVLVAVRGDDEPEFDERDAQVLTQLAIQGAPFVSSPSSDVEPEPAAQGHHLFRPEAIAQREFAKREGDLLRVFPRSLDRAYVVMVAALVVVGLAILFIRVPRYATGPVVVVSESSHVVNAIQDGTVAAVAVAVGDQVRRGEEVVRLATGREQVEFERLNREFERLLVQHLHDGAASTTAQNLIAVRLERDQARDRLEARIVRAPTDGRVSDLRVRAGQFVAAGQFLLAIGGEDGDHKIIALLSGESRPLLKPGMRLRVAFAAFPHTYQAFTVRYIGEEVIGPEEARRALGPLHEDALPQNPVVLVEADIPGNTFHVDDNSYRYHDGMRGTADVLLRHERLVFVLLPQLRRLESS